MVAIPIASSERVHRHGPRLQLQFVERAKRVMLAVGYGSLHYQGRRCIFAADRFEEMGYSDAVSSVTVSNPSPDVRASDTLAQIGLYFIVIQKTFASDAP